MVGVDGRRQSPSDVACARVGESAQSTT